MKRFIFCSIALATWLSWPIHAQRTASNPFGAQLNVQDAGTCSTSNSFAWQTLPINSATTTLNLSGTWTATVTVRESNNGGGSWSTVATLTTAGTTTYATSGFTDFCADVTVFTSGIVQVSISTGLNLGPQGPPGVGSAAPNSPLPSATSGPGPVFNVKNYGAKGNHQSSQNCTTSTFNLNCSDITFTTANVNQTVSCIQNGGGALFGGTPTTFSAFVDAHDMTLAATGGSFSASCLFGTPDDAAVTAAVTAALAQVCSRQSIGNVCVSTAAPTVYFPAGSYGMLNVPINVAPAVGTSSGFAVKGDGVDQTKLYWHEGASNSTNSALTINGNNYFNKIENITFDGANMPPGFSNALVLAGTSGALVDVRVQRFPGVGVFVSGSFTANRLAAVSNSGVGFSCSGCQGEIYESLLSNNGGAGLTISNVGGLTNGAGFRLVNSILDENAPAGGCDVIVQNTMDTWFQGTSIFGSVGAATNKCGLSIDGQSYVHWTGGTTGPFASEFPKTGVTIAAGGVLQASDVRFVGAGTGNCVVNNGTLNDNGGNSCETVYAISSGTSTGTTAVLTLASNTVNVNTNCAVGDALLVESAGISGYNGYYPAGATTGITAVTATTITYTTSGSNLGALGASGNAYCRNLITYSGTLPRALLNNPIPNTCYITGTFAATTAAAPMCAFKLGSATNITAIKAASTTTTACTVAPVVTISDGTVSETLTITTAKSIWDSSVDVSSGVGTTVFKPNGTITLSNTVGTCTTPPTNFSVSYNISPILSN